MSTLPTARRRAPLWALLAATVVSSTGNALTRVAIPWFVLQTRGSAAETGLVVFAETLPLALGGFFGGALVDRLGHRRASVASDLASGTTLALVPLLHGFGLLPFWLLLALVFLGALLDAPGGAARQALLPEAARLAGTGLERANAAYSAFFRLSILVGPVLGGALVALLGAHTVLWVDAATFALSAFLVGSFAPAGRAQASETPARGYAGQLAEGVRFLRTERALLALVVAPGFLTLFLSPLYYVVMPVWLQTGGGSAATLGAVFSAFGEGAVLGAIGYGIVGARFPRRALYRFCVAGSAAGAVVIAALPPLPVVVGASVLIGVALGPISPLAGVVTQERTPERLRGRVFGVLGATAQLATPLGVLLAGALLRILSIPMTAAALAGGCALVALAELLRPSFGETDRTDRLHRGGDVLNTSRRS